MPISMSIRGLAACAGQECSVRQRQLQHCAVCLACSRIGAWEESATRTAAQRAARIALPSTTPARPVVGPRRGQGRVDAEPSLERVSADDVQKAAAIVAAAVWNVANRDQMIPRFTKETMPAPVVAR